MAERAQRSSSRTTGRATPAGAGGGRRTRSIAAPVLVRQVRDGNVESEHRGHVVEVDTTGRVVRAAGDPGTVVMLRSTVKPLGLLALVEAGGVEAFDLSAPELAVMAGSHSGEDLHVRTLQDVFRRSKISQSALACGIDHAPLDAITAARLARDGERPSPIRHNCSGNHPVLLLLARLGDWPLEDYWDPLHPAMRAFSATVARVFGIAPERMVSATDNCGIPTFAFRLRDVARSYAFLAAPELIPAGDPRAALAPSLIRVRDAMRGHPELVGGTRDRLDTALMKAAQGRLVSKSGAEALRAIGLLAAPARPPTGIAIKIADGDGADRAGRAVAIETLIQAAGLDDRAVRELGRYHRPPTFDPHGRLVAEAVPDFQLAPVGELA